MNRYCILSMSQFTAKEQRPAAINSNPEVCLEKSALYELLTMVSDVDVPLSDRKDAAVQLKEIIQNYWKLPGDGGYTECLSSEQKEYLKATILDIMSKTAYSVRSHLGIAFGHIVWEDYPENWPDLVDIVFEMISWPKDEYYLSTGLLGLIAITDVYLVKKCKKKEHLFASLAGIETLVFHHCSRLLHSRHSIALNVIKHGIQFIYALSQVRLDFPRISVQAISNWAHLSVALLAQDFPSALDDDVSVAWWSCREWALRLLHYLLEWCEPATEFPHSYLSFARQFFTKKSDEVLQAIMSLLYVDVLRVDVIMPEELRFRALSFINTAVAQSHGWGVVKPYAVVLIKDVLFPLLCHIDPQEEKWNCDDEPDIRVLFASFEYWYSDGCEILSLLRGFIEMDGVMRPILEFAIEILTRDSASSEVEAALHLLGELRLPLTRHRKFEKDIKHILGICTSRLNDENVLIKARAAWCIRLYSTFQLCTRSVLSKMVSSLVALLGSTSEHILVKIEGLLALHSIFKNQKKGGALLERYAVNIIGHVFEFSSRKLLEEFDQAVDDLLAHFSDKVIIAAAESINRKASLWLQNIGSIRACDRITTLNPLIRTINYIFNTVEDCTKILVKIEPNISSIIKNIFIEEKTDLFREGLVLMRAMLRDRISKPMWEAFDYLFYVYTFCDDQGIPPYTVLFEVIHLYLVVDTKQFLAVPLRLQTVVDLCRTTLKGDDNWTEHLYAAKIMECAILQCKDAADPFVVEAIRIMILLAHQRLKRPIGENLKELKPLLLLVVVAAFCTREELFYAYLVPGHPKPLDYLCDELLSVYVDISGVHNRKMALLGICDFLNLPETERPAIVSHNLRKIIEVCIFIFGGLQRVMKIQSGICTKDLDTDMRSESDDHMDSFSDDDEEDAGYIDESVTEKFETFLDKEDALDIFVYFKETIDELKHFEPELVASAVSSLNHRKLKSLQALIKECEQRVNSGL